MTHESQDIEIIQIPIEEIKVAEYNPRKHSDKQFDELKESIKKFGMIDPVICNNAPNRKNILIGGHFRVAVAKELGLKTVPVVFLTISDIKKEKELNLRLNKNTGTWDMELLKNFETEFLLGVGFSDMDLGDIWNDVLTIEDDHFKEDEELSPETKTTSIRQGDMFELGRHRLICGDSKDAVTLDRLMGSDLADVIYTDPIFNIGLDYNKGLGGKQSYGGTTNDKKTDTQYKEFLKEIFANALKHSKKDLHVFSYCDQKYIWLLQTLFQELNIKNQRVCLWIKNGLNLTPQIAFNKCYEPVVYGTIGNPYLAPTLKNLNEITNQEVGSGNRAIEDILDMMDIWLEKRMAGQDYEHPTSKPPTLHEKPLRRCSKVDDIVLDVFGGSGSTLIACEQLKRRAYIVEIEPIFCELIIQRYEQLTGNKAKLIQ